MLSSKTVLVIGAGASSEANLPVGEELKQKIAAKLAFKFEFGRRVSRSGDDVIFEFLLRSYREKVSDKFDACLNISAGIELSSSIDNFIDSHKHDIHITETGKIAIARSILEAEKGSKLYISPANIYNKLEFSALRGTWYISFYTWLAQQADKTNLANIFDNLTVISFNYDRCLQHFLVHAIAQNYLIPIPEAIIIVRKLHIFFPYGSVGSYLSETKPDVPFGSETLPPLEKILGGLKTYTEQIEHSSGLAGVRDAIAHANKIIYLGNAYHDNNMTLLGGGESSSRITKEIFATKKGIFSADDLNIVKAKLDKVNSREGLANYHFSETCFELFQQFGRSMRGI